MAICALQDTDRLLAAMRSRPLDAQAALIGELVQDAHRSVQMRTAFGGSRVVDWLSGEQLARICQQADAQTASLWVMPNRTD